jgi:tetratricopeptide (TPR) repeat protein
VRAEADIEGLARVVLAIGVAERETGTTQSSTIELHDEMLGRIPEENATLHLRVLNSLGRGLTLVGDFGRASICANQAIALARRLGSQRDLTEALELRFLIPVGLVPEEIDEYRNLGRELAAATWLEGDPWTYLRILIHQAYWSAQFGDGAAFRGWLARWFDVVRERKLHYLIAVTAQARAMVAILQGDFAAAERFAGEAFEVGQRELGGMAHGIYGIHMFTVRREQGRLGEVVGLFKRFVDEAPAGSAWEPGFALMASDLGFDAPARRSLGKLASSDFALPLDAMRTTTLAFFAEVAVKLSDRESAKSIYGLLLPYAHMTVTVGLTVVCYGSAGRFLGLLADLLEDQPAAEQHFERALEVNTRMEAWPWLAHTQADYAAALRRWGSAADLARAAELAAAARASAERLGMAFLQKKLAAQLN